MAHAFARQQVQGNQGQWLHVDYILVDFLGLSMQSWLMSVNHRWACFITGRIGEIFSVLAGFVPALALEPSVLA